MEESNHDRYYKSANKSEQDSKRRKVEIVTVGDYVTVRVPYQDRLAADLKRVPAVVVEVLGKKRLSYRLRYVI